MMKLNVTNCVIIYGSPSLVKAQVADVFHPWVAQGICTKGYASLVERKCPWGPI